MERDMANKLVTEAMLSKGLVSTPELKEAMNKDSLHYAMSLYTKSLANDIKKNIKAKRLKVTVKEANISAAYWLEFEGETASDFGITGSMLISINPGGGGQDKIRFGMAIRSMFSGDYEEKWELEAWESSKNLTKQIAQSIENLG